MEETLFSLQQYKMQQQKDETIQQGGTGKKTNSTMIDYALSEMGYKVLLCDLDPQANATTLFLKTKASVTDESVTFNKTLMAAIQEEDLGQMECGFLIPQSGHIVEQQVYQIINIM